MATPEGTPGTALRTDVFEYDKMGNRMGTHNLASQGSTNFTRDNNGLNQYSSWTPSAIRQDDEMGGDWGSPGHANGVTMQEGWITASFNALNQPMAIWSSAYGSNFLWFGYDPLGRCVKRWMGSETGNAPNSNPATYYYYDGADMVQEGGSAISTARIYVHGAGSDAIVASQAVSTGEWRYYHYDGQGNCILLTDTSGAIREQYDYDAFGMPYVYDAGGYTLAAAAQWGNRFLFTGREWLSELRIYDYRARQYQPELGRFLQPDPKEFSAGDYNLYRYCHNDPVNKSDPTGLASESVTASIWNHEMWFQSGSFLSSSQFDAVRQGTATLSWSTPTVTGQYSRSGPHDPTGRGTREASESDAPWRMLLTEPETTEGYDRDAHYQLASSANKPLSGGNFKFQEDAHPDPKSDYKNIKTTTDEPPHELPRGGLYKDHAGFDIKGRPKSDDPPTKAILNVGFKSYYPNGQPGPIISTKMQQVSTHKPNEKPTVRIYVTRP